MENEERKPNAHGQRADIGLKLTVSGITLKSQSSPDSRVFHPCPIREFYHRAPGLWCHGETCDHKLSGD